MLLLVFILSNCSKEDPPRKVYRVFIIGGNVDHWFTISGARGNADSKADIRNGYYFTAIEGDEVLYQGHDGNAVPDTLHLLCRDSTTGQIFFDRDVICKYPNWYPKGSFFIQ